MFNGVSGSPIIFFYFYYLLWIFVMIELIIMSSKIYNIGLILWIKITMLIEFLRTVLWKYKLYTIRWKAGLVEVIQI